MTRETDHKSMKTKEYKVWIRRYTHTRGQRERMQEQKEMRVTAPVHRPKLAAIAAGCPKSAKTLITGAYTTEIHVCDMENQNPGWIIRNWTEWIVITPG